MGRKLEVRLEFWDECAECEGTGYEQGSIDVPCNECYGIGGERRGVDLFRVLELLDVDRQKFLEAAAKVDEEPRKRAALARKQRAARKATSNDLSELPF